jgi:CDGSH-type Zn-finger protein
MAAPKHGTSPIYVDEMPGKKAYCTCGWSDKIPYCDGAHKRLETGCKSVKVELMEGGPRWVCQCHQSKDMPWCDGTHGCLPKSDPDVMT